MGFLNRLLLLLACFASVCVATAQAPYAIRNYSVDIKLAKSGVMSVREQITAEFLIPRRGIIRSIPFQYDTGKGQARQVFITNIRVGTDNGAGVPTKIWTESANIKIRTGKEDVIFPPQTQITYVFEYDVEGMLNRHHLDGWDKTVELYWNAIGDQWDTTIDRAEIRLSFPTTDTPMFRVFYGPYGSRTFVEPKKLNTVAKDPTGKISADVSKSGASVLCEKQIPPGSAISVVLALPDKLIDQPTWWQSIKLWLLPNLGFGIPLLVLPLMTFFWARFGRDPHGGPMVVQFDPPDDLSGPEVGTFLDETVDTRDISSGIVSLAVKGYLRIIIGETGMLFKKKSATLELTNKTPSPELTAFEASLLTYFSEIGDVIEPEDLRRYVAPHISTLKNQLYRTLVDRGYYIGDPNSVRAGWMIGGFVAVGILGFITFQLSPFKTPLPSIVGAILGAIAVGAFSMHMPRRTVMGAKKWQLVRGFEEFMRRARAHEFEWMAARHPDQALFEKYLPHAVAFGLTEQWANAFSDIVRELPDWYVVPHGMPYHWSYLGSDLGTITNDIGAAASTPPRSSGASGGGSGFSSGGGFSGGGFGGGGGSSW